MRRSIAILLLIATVSAVLFSCGYGEKNQGEAYVKFIDDTKNEIKLSKKPQRVAVLFSSFADVWLIAGGEIYVTVGETVERGFAAEGTLLVDSGAGKTVNTELLIAYSPDLVICSADVKAQASAASLLNSVGIPAACFAIESFADYLRVLGIFTDITGNKEALRQYGTDLSAGIENVISQSSEKSSRPRILFIRAGSSARSTKAKTAKEHFACAMLDELGAINIADNAPILIDGLSIEEILRQNPEIIFITPMGDEAASRKYVESLFSEAVWQQLKAVREGRYYFLEKELFQYKPNSKWLEAYRILSEILYENDK